MRKRLPFRIQIGVASFRFSTLLCVLACLSLAIAFVLLGHEVGEDAGRPHAFDLAIGNTLVEARSPSLDRWMPRVTLLGDERVLLILGPLFVAAIWMLRGRSQAILFAVTVVGGFVLVTLLKIIVARLRPDRWEPLTREASLSFPSGHTAMATIVFGSLAASVLSQSRGPIPGAIAATVAICIALAVAASRIYLGVHWATDTVAGLMIGLFCVLAYAAIIGVWPRQSDRRWR